MSGGKSDGKKTGIIIAIVVIVIIILLLIGFGIYYFYYRNKKAKEAVTAAAAAARDLKPRALNSYSGANGLRKLSLYWYSPTAGLYVLEYNGNMQYGCFNAVNNVLGGSRVMIYSPTYNGNAVALPDPSVCNNSYGDPIVTMVVSAPNSLGVVNASVTSSKASDTNTLSLASGDVFNLNQTL